MRGLSIVFVALVLAAPATATTPLERRVNRLQAQVMALQQQTKALRAANAELKLQVRSVRDYAECSLWINHDFTRLTWTTLDAIALRVMGSVAFGPQTRGDDRGACERSGITRSLTMSLLTFGLPR